MQKKGYRCAVLDADITGPSIPRMFGIRKKAASNETGIQEWVYANLTSYVITHRKLLPKKEIFFTEKAPADLVKE